MPETVVNRAQFQCAKNRGMRDAAQGKDCSAGVELIDLLAQINIAEPDFLRRWFILGWHTAHRIGDPAVDQLQIIIAGNGLPGARETVKIEAAV